MTTPYHVKLAPAAYLQLKNFPLKQQKFILRLLEALAVNPRPEISKKIEGMMGLYSEAINHTRLIYKIEDQDILVLLIK